MKRDREENGQDGRLKKRLRGVRKRKEAQRGFGYDVAFKMRLVKVKEQRDGQS